MARQQLIQSAKFKRDYVAYSAIILFFCIVAGEILLAIAIPAYVSREDVLALQENRIRLQREFDTLRHNLNHLKPATQAGKNEIRLLQWHTDCLAPYLRQYSGDLTLGELTELRDACRKIRLQAVRSAGKEPAARRRTLDERAAMELLLPQVKGVKGTK